MKIDPRHLVQLAIVLEKQSFSRAAAALGTTQPALSKMVGDLERRLGAPLLEQRRSPVLPSPLGQALAARGHAIRAALDEAELAISGTRSGTRGVIRVGAPPFFCDNAIPELILSFRTARPGVSFELHTAYQPELLDMVEERHIDIAMVPTGMEQSARPFSARPLTRLSHAVICRAGHPLLARPVIDASALSQAQWISQTSGSKMHQLMTDALSGLGVSRIDTVLKSNSASTLMKALRSTDCLTVLPVFVALPGIYANALEIVPTRPLPSLAFGTTFHSAVPLSQATKAFLRHVETSFAAIESETQRLIAMERPG